MRVLGIDCGTERTGYGVIDSDGRAHRMVAAGCIRSSAREPLERRLLNIADGLRNLIVEYRPDAAAVEEVFFAVNAKSARRNRRCSKWLDRCCVWACRWRPRARATLSPSRSAMRHTRRSGRWRR